MTEQATSDGDAEAAALAWAVLQFAQSALPLATASSPTLGGSLGEVGVRLFPTGRTVPLADMPRALQDLPKPVVLGSLSARGHVGVWSLDHAGPAERRRMEHELENQSGWLRTFCERFGLAPESRVLLDTELDTRVVTVSTVARYLRDYGILVGWSMRELRGDPRAEAQLVLTTGGGHHSPGWRDEAQA